MLLSFDDADRLMHVERSQMNAREPDDLADYEQRIAALEAKLRALESQLVRPGRGVAALRPQDRRRRDMACSAPGRSSSLGFGLFTPTMLTWPPYASMLGFNAIIVVLTLGLIIPLTAGDFDLSVASTLTLSAMLVAILNVKAGLPIAGGGHRRACWSGLWSARSMRSSSCISASIR